MQHEPELMKAIYNFKNGKSRAKGKLSCPADDPVLKPQN